MTDYPVMHNVRLTYRSNRLYCARYRTREENKRACLEALAILTGLTIEQLTDPEHPESVQAVDASFDLYMTR